MCLAAFAPAGVTIRRSHLVEAGDNNPHGCGYAFARNGHLVIRKFEDVRELIPAYEHDAARYSEGSAFLVHFRIMTHGAINKRNTHPHTMRDGGALIHNGMIDIPELPAGESDSRYFAREIIGALPSNWMYDPILVNMVERYIGDYNKVAMLWPDGSSLILNERAGHWQDGVWYSNKSYLWDYYASMGYGTNDEGTLGTHITSGVAVCPACAADLDADDRLFGECQTCGAMLPFDDAPYTRTREPLSEDDGAACMAGYDTPTYPNVTRWTMPAPASTNPYAPVRRTARGRVQTFGDIR